MNTYKFRTFRHLKDYLEKLPDEYLDSFVNIEGIDSSHGLLIKENTQHNGVIICELKHPKKRNNILRN